MGEAQRTLTTREQEELKILRAAAAGALPKVIAPGCREFSYDVVRELIENGCLECSIDTERLLIAPLWMILSGPALMAVSWLIGSWAYDMNTGTVWHGAGLIVAAVFYGMWLEQRVWQPCIRNRKARQHCRNPE